MVRKEGIQHHLIAARSGVEEEMKVKQKIVRANILMKIEVMPIFLVVFTCKAIHIHHLLVVFEKILLLLYVIIQRVWNVFSKISRWLCILLM